MSHNTTQHICLFVYDKQSNDPSQIDQLNTFYSNRESRILGTDYWFVLHSQGNIIAECGVYLNFCSWILFCKNSKKNKYIITDVLVHQLYRGNGYCSLLLLNVMDWFTNKDTKNEPVFSLWADASNRSARKAYQKIFGYKGNRKGRLVYFSTQNDLIEK
jgi:hypothetical protein